MKERMPGPMKTRRNKMNDELRPEYDLGQLLTFPTAPCLLSAS